MVLHEIESIMDVINGHRVIMYYIEDDSTSTWNLRNSVESVMEMLGKKNDDLIIFKVCQNTQQFNQFKDLYKPDISGPIALFVINAEGIPLICEHIYKEDNIHQAFDSICSYCKLNPISKSEISKVISCESRKPFIDETDTEMTSRLKSRPSHQTSETSFCENDLSVLDSDSVSSKDHEESVKYTSTVLQIRLPDGTKERQKFDKDAFLQEVHEFVRAKLNMNDFDLKTYNRNIFSTEDYEKTLQDLDLTPNGVVTVVYKSVVPFRGNGIISRFIHFGFWIFYARVTSTFKYVQGLVYAFWNSFFSSGTRSSRDTQGQESYSGGKKSSSNGVKRSTPRFGNIHTLGRNDDSDDENNRYNGNSTQQK